MTDHHTTTQIEKLEITVHDAELRHRRAMTAYQFYRDMQQAELDAATAESRLISQSSARLRELKDG